MNLMKFSALASAFLSLVCFVQSGFVNASEGHMGNGGGFALEARLLGTDLQERLEADHERLATELGRKFPSITPKNLFGLIIDYKINFEETPIYAGIEVPKNCRAEKLEASQMIVNCKSPLGFFIQAELWKSADLKDKVASLLRTVLLTEARFKGDLEAMVKTEGEKYKNDPSFGRNLLRMDSRDREWDYSFMRVLAGELAVHLEKFYSEEAINLKSVPLESDFKNFISSLISKIEKSPFLKQDLNFQMGSQFTVLLKTALKRTEVEFSDDRLLIPGKLDSKVAVNWGTLEEISKTPQIRVNAPLWNRFLGRARGYLVLHEYLPILGIPDNDFKATLKILRTIESAQSVE